jgi:hypothetical protein
MQVPPVGLVAVKVEGEDGNKTSLCPLCLNRFTGSLTMRPFKGKSNHRSVTGVASSYSSTLLTASHTSPPNDWDEPKVKFYFNFHQFIHRKMQIQSQLIFPIFFKNYFSYFSIFGPEAQLICIRGKNLTWGSRGWLLSPVHGVRVSQRSGSSVTCFSPFFFTKKRKKNDFFTKNV